MAEFETAALASAVKKPNMWLRYVDDTFVLWDHGKAELESFLAHLNSVNQTIQFTMELEKESQLPFLDVLVKKVAEHVESSVYRKPTHTDQYLHWDSNHPSGTKQGVVRCLGYRAKNICSTESNLRKEQCHLRQAFMKNGYSGTIIDRGLHQTLEPKLEPERPTATAVIPYVSRTTEQLKRIGAKYGIRMVARSQNTIKKQVNTVAPKQDKLTKRGVVYSIPCEPCGKAYIGETGRPIKTRISEHKTAVKYTRTDQNAVAEHRVACNCTPNFENVSILAMEENRFKRQIREALEIRKAGGNTFAQTSYHLSTAWNRTYLHRQTNQ